MTCDDERRRYEYDIFHHKFTIGRQTKWNSLDEEQVWVEQQRKKRPHEVNAQQCQNKTKRAPEDSR